MRLSIVTHSVWQRKLIILTSYDDKDNCHGATIVITTILRVILILVQKIFIG